MRRVCAAGTHAVGWGWERRAWQSHTPYTGYACYAQFKAINWKWTQVEIDRSLDGRDVNLEPIFKVGKMPKEMPLSDKPYRKKLGYDAPAIAPQYRYVNLDLKYW